MKIFADIEKTFGTHFVYVGVRPWTDFNSGDLLGVHVEVLALDTYERFSVKVPVRIEDFKKIQKGSSLEFKNLEGVVYTQKGFPQVSCSASSVVICHE